MSGNETLFDNLDELFDASMDDLDDLPPQGVPPSGHYNVTVTFGTKTIGEGKDEREVPCCDYVVDAINELSDPEEEGEVKVGQQFTEFFHLKTKKGEKNTFGIGTLKERLKPHSERAGTTNIGELMKNTKQVAIAATLKRRENRKQEGQYNMQLTDVIVL